MNFAEEPIERGANRNKEHTSILWNTIKDEILH